MLKSTYKVPAGLSPLLEGWTEHRAPTGHLYYYNAVTKESTYTRPVQSPSIFHETAPLPVAQPVNGFAFHYTQSYPNRHSLSHSGPSQGSKGSRGGYGDHYRPQPRDRPKKAYRIQGCEPWQLVQTKLGRRFVYSPEKEESFWRFPPDVMKGVVEYDRLQREQRRKAESGEAGDHGESEQAAAEAELVMAEDNVPAGPERATQKPSHPLLDSDGEEYEEVEVTDDEDEEHDSKRQKNKNREAEQLIEFTEDDIADQLAAMGEDYGLDPGEYGDGEGKELGEGAEGLALTEEDSKALFMDMLRDYQISPYTTWDKVIEAGQIVEDDRYTVLPNMKSRREVWDEWSRDRIQRIREQREKEEKKDPKIPYFAFLEKHATLKLYWPEFRRKYKKEPEMHNTKLNDKDREKWYREYVGRLKLAETNLKADLVKLLKDTPLNKLNRSSDIDNLPSSVLTDVRFISLRRPIRDPLIEAHISTLPPAPTNNEISPEEQETRAKEAHDRERRQQALAERQKRVDDEKKRQQEALRSSKGRLREEEEEVQRAMRTGKEGLLGHMATDE